MLVEEEENTMPFFFGCLGGASKPDTYKNRVWILSYVDIALGIAMILFTPSYFLIFGVLYICFATGGLYGVTNFNRRAIKVYLAWKIFISLLIAAAMIYVAIDATTICTYLDPGSTGFEELHDCESKVGLLAVFTMIVTSLASGYSCLLISRFSDKVQKLKITEGCRSSGIETSVLKRRRLFKSLPTQGRGDEDEEVGSLLYHLEDPLEYKGYGSCAVYATV